MKSDFLTAITQLAAERNLPKTIVLNVVESALASAYKKDNLAEVDLNVKIQLATGEIRTFIMMTVVDELTDDKREFSVQEAQRYNEGAEIGDTIEIETVPTQAGRIAAQTAKQVILQRLREAERDLVFSEFSTKVDDILSGSVHRMEGRNIMVDLGRGEGILPPPEQVPTERYRPGQRLRVYLLEVSKSPRGTQILLSRTHRDLVKRLLELEVPEIHNGSIEIKAISREPGLRAKVAVFARQANVDAVGSCIGLRGMRIQNIVNELQGEKIDVIEWHRDPSVLIARALAPAQVTRVQINEQQGTALVVVPDRQLSLAIGKEGQNARLAAKITGWHIDIKSASQIEEEKAKEEPVAVAEESQEPIAPEETAPEGREAQVLTPVAVVEAQPGASQEGTEPLPVEEPQPVGQVLAEALTKDATWQAVTASPRAPQIRFAEDIMGPKPPAKKEKGKRDVDEAPAKRAKSKRVHFDVVDELEEHEGIEEQVQPEEQEELEEQEKH